MFFLSKTEVYNAQSETLKLGCEARTPAIRVITFKAQCFQL